MQDNADVPTTHNNSDQDKQGCSFQQQDQGQQSGASPVEPPPAVEDVAAEQPFSSANIEVNDSDIKQLYAGNREVTVNNNIFGGEGKVAPVSNQAQQLSFPNNREQVKFVDDDTLAQRRQFYRTHRWLIIEANADNTLYISDAIALLLSEEKDHLYYEQQREVRCQDYVKFSHRFIHRGPSITKLPIGSLLDFKYFIETPENFTELTNALEDGNNKLLIIVNCEDGERYVPEIRARAAKLEQDIDAHYAYWNPKVVVEQQSSISVENRLDWMGKSILALAAWFTSLPYALFHQVILQLLESKQQAQQTLVEPLTDDEFSLWLQNWRQHPDQYLTQYGLTSVALSTSGFSGIGLADAELRAAYRQFLLQNSPYLLTELLSPLTDALFSFEPKNAADTYPVISELARFYQALDNHGVSLLNTASLTQMFERYRYLHSNSTTTIFRLIDFIKALYRQPQLQPMVDEFTGDLVKALHQAESQLNGEQSIQDLAGWPHFTDTLYATFNILSWSIGLHEASSVGKLEHLIASSLALSKARKITPVMFNKLNYMIRGLRASDCNAFLQLLCELHRAGPSVYPQLSKLACRLFYELCKKIGGDNGKDQEEDLNYLLSLICSSAGAEALTALLALSSNAVKEGETLVRALIRLKTELDKLSATVHIEAVESFAQIYADAEQQICRMLANLARAVSKETFYAIKNFSKQQTDDARTSSVSHNQSREQRYENKIYRQACSFVSTGFHRKTTEA